MVGYTAPQRYLGINAQSEGSGAYRMGEVFEGGNVKLQSFGAYLEGSSCDDELIW
jgi:hypothetical protein